MDHGDVVAAEVHANRRWQHRLCPLVGERWRSGRPHGSTPSFEDIAQRFDANKDGKISLEEFAAEPRLQRGFSDNDLAGDGYVDERDWNFYRARRNARNTLLAVKTGARGDLTGVSSILWRMQKFLPNVPSPLLYNEVLYLIKDGGILTAVNAKTGEILKQGRLTGALETYYASPVAANGHVYLMSQGGKLTVVKAGPQWEIASTNDFEDEAYATPAIVENAIYIRTRGALYCFR